MVARGFGAPRAAPGWSSDWLEEVFSDCSVEANDFSDLKAAQAQRSQRMEVLGQLAGGVAHDFNNLLGVILSYAGFVSEELAVEVARGAERHQRWAVARNDIEQIQAAVERATGLTRQLLAFARREVIQPRVLDLNDRVAAVEVLLRRTLGAQLELVTTLPTNLWPILADPGHIEQVLVNLAVNARDAMPDGGTLRIDTANVDVDGDLMPGGLPSSTGRHVRLRIADNGIGMSGEVMAHVFEPFFTTKGKGGTGLGLATVYGIVVESDATITIESELGTGTTFTIIFPATDNEAAQVEKPTSYQRVPQGETILVVEDQEALREVTQRILTRHGYRVITAADGPEAVTLAENHGGEIHLLVTDVVMPKMLGKEVAQRIRDLRPNIKALYMSGYAQPVLASQGKLEAGVTLIDKPFSATALLDKIGHVLNGQLPIPRSRS